jgi:hypothetical protein
MHSMQPAALQPVPDRTSSDPDGSELPSGDDPSCRTASAAISASTR